MSNDVSVYVETRGRSVNLSQQLRKSQTGLGGVRDNQSTKLYHVDEIRYVEKELFTYSFQVHPI